VTDRDRFGENRAQKEERELQLQERHRARERRKLIGLLPLALFILALAFLRFGKTIPWGAR
jgi:hypothetical protein